MASFFDAWGVSWGNPSAWGESWQQREAGGGDPDRSRRRRRTHAVARKRLEQRRRWIEEEKRRRIVAREAQVIEFAKQEKARAEAEAEVKRVAAIRHTKMAAYMTRQLERRVVEEQRAAKLARDEEAMLVLLLAA